MLKGVADSRWGLAEYGLSSREAILAESSVSYQAYQSFCFVLAHLAPVKLLKMGH